MQQQLSLCVPIKSQLIIFFSSIFPLPFSLSLSFSLNFYQALNKHLPMQSTIHITTDQEVDAHAPSSTYYTTGLNAGGVIGRLKSYTVSVFLYMHTC